MSDEAERAWGRWAEEHRIDIADRYKRDWPREAFLAGYAAGKAESVYQEVFGETVVTKRDRRQLLVFEALRAAADPACETCGRPASCYGAYEGRADEDAGFACDECCGHGNEDGWCLSIREPDEDAKGGESDDTQA